MYKKKSPSKPLTWPGSRTLSGALTKSGPRDNISSASCFNCNLTNMGGKATKKASAGNTEENVNVGLLNISSNSQSILSVETILEVLSFIILALLVIRWIRKCLLARNMAQEQRMIDVLQPNNNNTRQQTSFIQEIPSAPRAIMNSQEPMGQNCQEVYPQLPMTQKPQLIGLEKYR